LHYKKDGTLDMRYSSSKAVAAQSNPSYNVSSGCSRPQSASQSSSSNLHYKKDGTLDMRYSSSKASVAAQSPQLAPDLHYKKDGTLDMRYRSSKEAAVGAASPNSVAGLDLHFKKDGTLDMRYSSSKAFAAQSSSSSKLAAGIQGLNLSSSFRYPSNLPLRKDGKPDKRYKVVKEWLRLQAKAVEQASCNFPSRSSVDCCGFSRSQYWTERSSDEGFVQAREEQRKSEIAPPTICEENVLASEGVDVGVLEIPADQFAFDQSAEELGRGAFGVVRKAIWREQQVAVKSLHCTALTRAERKDFDRELKAMCQAGNHPNIIQLFGYCLQPLCLVMELAKYGSLTHVLHYSTDAHIEANITDGRIKKKIAVGILNALIRLQSCNITHGDIKPQNVLLVEDFVPKITDFGLVRLRAKSASSTNAAAIAAEDDDVGGRAAGTAAYMAPELLQLDTFASESTDVYSYGIVLNELIQEEEPYSEQYNAFLGKGPYAAANYAQAGRRPQMHDDTPVDLKGIIQRCWHAVPSNRPKLSVLITLLLSVEFPESFGLAEA